MLIRLGFAANCSSTTFTVPLENNTIFTLARALVIGLYVNERHPLIKEIERAEILYPDIKGIRFQSSEGSSIAEVHGEYVINADNRIDEKKVFDDIINYDFDGDGGIPETLAFYDCDCGQILYPDIEHKKLSCGIHNERRLIKFIGDVYKCEYCERDAYAASKR